MTHDVKAQQKADRCEPSVPAPQQQEEYCEGTFRIEKCCCNKITRTFILNLGPQSEAQLQAFLQNTVSSYEQAGYCIEAHSIVDVGAGWLLGLTVSWHT